MTLSLGQLLWAVRERRLNVTAETSASLVLALAEQLALAPRELAPRRINLTQSGQLLLEDGVAVPSRLCAAQLTALLSELLSFAGGDHPALVQCGRSSPVSLEALSAVLAQALVPMNRAAAKRALARLHRRLAALAPPSEQQDVPQATLAAPLKAREATPYWDIDVAELGSAPGLATSNLAAPHVAAPKVAAPSLPPSALVPAWTAPAELPRAQALATDPLVPPASFGFCAAAGEGTPFIGSFLSVTPRVLPRVAPTTQGGSLEGSAARDAAQTVAQAPALSNDRPACELALADCTLVDAALVELQYTPRVVVAADEVVELTWNDLELEDPTTVVQARVERAPTAQRPLLQFRARLSDVTELVSAFQLESGTHPRRLGAALRRSLGLARANNEPTCTPPPAAWFAHRDVR